MGMFREEARETAAIRANLAGAADAHERLTAASVEFAKSAVAAAPPVSGGLLFNAAGQPIAPTSAPGSGGGRGATSGSGGRPTRNISLGGEPLIEDDGYVYQNIGGQIFRVARSRGPSGSSGGGGAGSGGGGASRLFPEFIPAGGNRPGDIDNGAGRNVDFGKVSRGEVEVIRRLDRVVTGIERLARSDYGAGLRRDGAF